MGWGEGVCGGGGWGVDKKGEKRRRRKGRVGGGAPSPGTILSRHIIGVSFTNERSAKRAAAGCLKQSRGDVSATASLSNVFWIFLELCKSARRL